MPKLRHKQVEPLAIVPLDVERLDYFYNMLESDRQAFDDYTPLNKEELAGFLFGPNSMSFEIGDGVGLSTLVFDGVNAYVQMVMFDWFYRDYVCNEILKRAFQNGAERVTSTVTEDRNNARNLVLSLGFRYEGEMRKAFIRNNRYWNVELYGLMKETWYGNGSINSSDRDQCSGWNRGSGDLLTGSGSSG